MTRDAFPRGFFSIVRHPRALKRNIHHHSGKHQEQRSVFPKVPLPGFRIAACMRKKCSFIVRKHGFKRNRYTWSPWSPAWFLRRLQRNFLQIWGAVCVPCLRKNEVHVHLLLLILITSAHIWAKLTDTSAAAHFKDATTHVEDSGALQLLVKNSSKNSRTWLSRGIKDEESLRLLFTDLP